MFAPDKGRCTWIEEANRPGCRSKDKFEFSCPEVGPSEHPRYPDPAGLQNIYPLIILTSASSDCQKFYVCISGSAHHSSCNEGLVFHPLTLACDRQEVVDGPCSSWYNKTTVDALTLPDALPTPATGRILIGICKYHILCCSKTNTKKTGSISEPTSPIKTIYQRRE